MSKSKANKPSEALHQGEVPDSAFAPESKEEIEEQRRVYKKNRDKQNKTVVNSGRGNRKFPVPRRDEEEVATVELESEQAVQLTECMNKVADAEAQKLAAYKWMIFKGKSETAKGLEKFLMQFREEICPVSMKDDLRELLVDAALTVCQDKGWGIYLDGTEAVLSLEEKSNSKAEDNEYSFRVRTKGRGQNLRRNFMPDLQVKPF